MLISEKLLAFVWQYRLFKATNLHTTKGDTLQILHSGREQTDAGPDFFDARINLNGTLWAGCVEIHVKSSDWLRHRHQHDPAYQNVILHVVYEHDLAENSENVFLNNLPVLELKPLLNATLIARYNTLKEQKDFVPCAAFLTETTSLDWQIFTDKLIVARLEDKAMQISQTLADTQQDWEKVFWLKLGAAMGAKVNAPAFEMLCRITPLEIVRKIADDLPSLEALLLGQAGFLEKNYEDAYFQQLQQTYRHLQERFQLQPMNNAMWKFLRMRPANFPSIRIAQFAALWHREPQLLQTVLACQNLSELQSCFQVAASDYWNTHYLPDKLSKNTVKTLGNDMLHSLLINTLVPFIFIYGKYQYKNQYEDLAFSLLEEIPPEHNRIVAQWKQWQQIPTKNAQHTQALLHLYKHYCAEFRCLSCNIGYKLLKQSEL
ncbi:MAG: DUF2851 family protein [Chitinophagales bacterium]|nr:DUF2851 family protein [Bacteroidota bacterium]